MFVLTKCHHFDRFDRVNAFREAGSPVAEYRFETLHRVLRDLMEEKQFSIRRLSRESGVDHATISKILNGKRIANVRHLQQLSEGLGTDVLPLMQAAGYIEETDERTTNEFQSVFDKVQHVLSAIDGYEKGFTEKELQREIIIYEEKSLTEEGKRTILDRFQEKIAKLEGQGPYIKQLHSLFSRFMNRKGTVKELGLIGAALLYFVITKDLMPDFLFPVGFMDDALVVQVVMKRLDNKEFG